MCRETWELVFPRVAIPPSLFIIDSHYLNHPEHVIYKTSVCPYKSSHPKFPYWFKMISATRISILFITFYLLVNHITNVNKLFLRLHFYRNFIVSTLMCLSKLIVDQPFLHVTVLGIRETLWRKWMP